MKSQITVKRYPYEEPYHLQLEFFVSNGGFTGNTDFYCNAEDLKMIGQSLKNFPSNIDDEFRYEVGSENPEERYYVYFLLRVYTIDSVGHCAIQFVINKNAVEPYEGSCRFSIRAGAASINRLGVLFEKFSELKDFEFEWSPELSE
jgi:hypothetical protein